MAQMTGCAPLRALSHDFQNPHSKPLRRSKVKARPCRITQAVTVEALDVIEALAQCFAPLCETVDGPAFLCVLPEGLLERLAMLGAELADLEPSLGAVEHQRPDDQSLWDRGPAAADGEEDAGEMPELDDAEAGLADRDALDQWFDEHQAIGAFYAERAYRPDSAETERIALIARLHRLTRARNRAAAPALSLVTPEV